MNFFRLLGAYFVVSFMGEVAYRVNFFVQLFQTFLNLVVSLGGLAVIFSYTDKLGGWGPQEILALVGVYFLVGGLIGLVIQPGMEAFIQSVRDGTLDFTLIRPEDSQLLVSIGSIDIWKLIDILLGLGIMTWALIGLGYTVGLMQAGMFVLTLAAGGVIIYCFFLILATLSFWFVRIENILVIFQSMYEAGRWPVSLYPAWLRYGLTFVVPIAFATTIPAEALTNRLNLQTLLGAVGAALVLLVISRVIWRVGLRHYSGASA
jgi:ABC-2 type transport system permease protein